MLLRRVGLVWSGPRVSVVSLFALTMCRNFSDYLPPFDGHQSAGGGGEGGRESKGVNAPGGEGHGRPPSSGGATMHSAGQSAGARASGGTDGEDGAAGDGGAASPGGAGTSGAANGGGGASGDGGAPSTEGANGGGGASGDGGVATAGHSGSGPLGGEPGVLGAVRLMADGVPVCGGTLHTNSWVLTADRCVPAGARPESLRVGFGSSARQFEQLRTVVEVQRFPGNDGTSAERSIDLVLLGVDHPFVIDESTTRHHIPIWYGSSNDLAVRHICVGWDLRPDPDSSTDELRSVLLDATEVTHESDRSLVHWLNGNHANPGDGPLLTANDVGSGCFLPVLLGHHQTSVHVENPEPQKNQDGEAFSLALANTRVRSWLDATLFERVIEPLELEGPAAVCSFGEASFEMFSMQMNGGIAWHRWDGASWSLADSFAPPDVTLVSEKPGVLCSIDGGIELFARDVQGGLWWRSRSPEGAWMESWSVVTDATTALSSGVSVVGFRPRHFFVFARGAADELRYAEFDETWTGRWTSLGGILLGAPAAIMTHVASIDVMVRALDNTVYHAPYRNDRWYSWNPTQGTIAADPVVTTWGPHEVAVFTRDLTGTLQRRSYSAAWGDWIDTSLTLPSGELTGVARAPGSFDLFVSAPSERLSRVIWPRAPRATDAP